MVPSSRRETEARVSVLLECGAVLITGLALVAIAVLIAWFAGTIIITLNGFASANTLLPLG